MRAHYNVKSHVKMFLPISHLGVTFYEISSNYSNYRPSAPFLYEVASHIKKTAIPAIIIRIQCKYSQCFRLDPGQTYWRWSAGRGCRTPRSHRSCTAGQPTGRSCRGRSPSTMARRSPTTDSTGSVLSMEATLSRYELVTFRECEDSAF